MKSYPDPFASYIVPCNWNLFWCSSFYTALSVINKVYGWYMFPGSWSMVLYIQNIGFSGDGSLRNILVIVFTQV
jgi:hypothetical protein